MGEECRKSNGDDCGCTSVRSDGLLFACVRIAECATIVVANVHYVSHRLYIWMQKYTRPFVDAACLRALSPAGYDAWRSFDRSPAPRRPSRIASARPIENARVSAWNALVFHFIM